MKKFIKIYYPNFILIIFTILLLLYFEPYYFIAIPSLILSYLYQKGSIKNKNYQYASIYNIIFNIILYLFVIASFIYCLNTNGYDALGYAALSFLINIIIALNCILSFIIRLLFRFIYKQKFNYQEHIILNTIQIIITFISINGPFIFFFIMDK